MDVLFTRDPKQRLRIMRSLFAALNYLLCIALLFYTVGNGYTKLRDALLLTAWMLGTTALAYTIIRTGLNRRWFKDPALTLPQVVCAQIAIAWAYAITGPLHPGVLPLLALVLVFGMFNLNASHLRLVSFITIAVMGGVIFYKVQSDPKIYPPQAEWFYFLMVVLTLPTISLLALQLGAMRIALRDQRNTLNARNTALHEAIDRIQHMANHDELTGLFNRHRMMEALHEQVRLHARGGHRFCVVMIDLDLFKRINDAYGHNVGDEALRVFAQEARAAMRETDVLCRWGGEEFLFLLTNTPPGDPETGLNRLRAALVARRVCEAAGELHIKFSAGIAEYRAGETIESTIDRADKALYAAKAEGRDRTIVERLAA
jgi:diguanylate cyclase